MTHVERVVNSLERKTVDRIPLNFWGTDEFNAELASFFGTELDHIILW